MDERSTRLLARVWRLEAACAYLSRFVGDPTLGVLAATMIARKGRALHSARRALARLEART